MEFQIVDKELFIDGKCFEFEEIEFIEEIGAGKNATVFIVNNLIMDRFEAVKIWRPWKDNSAVSPEKFDEEIKKNGRFSGVQGIATIYTGGTKNGIFYAIMEYIEGPILKSYLKNGEIFNNRYCILSRILETIETVLEMGCFHGDLHHSNIIISKGKGNSPKPVIIDFGTSYFSGEKKSHKRDADMLYGMCFEIIPEFQQFEFIETNIVNEGSSFVCSFFRSVLNLMREYIDIHECIEIDERYFDMRMDYVFSLSRLKDKFKCLNIGLIEKHLINNSLDMELWSHIMYL